MATDSYEVSEVFSYLQGLPFHPPSHPQNTSVCSRISRFNAHVEQHQQWQRINPFSHTSVRDMPRPSHAKEQYGTAPTGSQSSERALKAQVQTLQEMLKLCELIHQEGHLIDWEDTLHRSIKFGTLFEVNSKETFLQSFPSLLHLFFPLQLYIHISDKLLGTLLCARRHKYIDFQGETLFQGRDDDEPVRLIRPYRELRLEILEKIKKLKNTVIQRPQEKRPVPAS